MSIRKFKGALVSAAVASMFVASAAQASDNVNVTVNATVVGVCKFFTASPTLDIRNTGASGSNIDPSLAGPASGSAAILYRCSNGTAPAFTVPASGTVTCTTVATCGSTTMAVSNVTSSNTGNGTGLGSGKDQTLTVNGDITQAVYQNAQVGSYQGTLAVSVTP